jgi:hypothetical protein
VAWPEQTLEPREHPEHALFRLAINGGQKSSLLLNRSWHRRWLIQGLLAGRAKRIPHDRELGTTVRASRIVHRFVTGHAGRRPPIAYSTF